MESPTTRDEPLATWGSGTAASNAMRRGDRVVAPREPSTDTVVALLRHLETAGFEAAPRVVDETTHDGRLALTFVVGESPHPHAWTADQVGGVGVLLSELHRATADFVVPSDAAWKPTWLRDVGDGRPVIGHGDVAPWNLLARDGVVRSLIDWEYAGPIDPVTELAYATWLNAQLHDDDIAELQQLPAAAERVRQAHEIMDGYGVARRDRTGVVERMIEVAVHSARAEAQDAAVSPTSTEAVDGTGYPVLWAIVWRARSASWMMRHRALLTRG